MQEYVFGANILENLTTGMYQDSRVVYREYIQNACDQIDKANECGVLVDGKGKIEIWLDPDNRIISIEDNATGIPAAQFRQTLGNIADSDKTVGQDKGFRGIGRLCGLAYCKELVFTSSFKGEDTVSIMRCDAKKMRELLSESVHGKKHTANDVLNQINNFGTESTTDRDSHFFKVDLIGINKENTDLLDFQYVKDYLSFIAPVPYQSAFLYRTEIYDYAKELEIGIDEYMIKLNGEQILKKYTTILKDPSCTKYDDIFDVAFKDFYDEDGTLIAWMWFGLSCFSKAIPKINQMRGLRLRKENIQIGGEDALQKLFKQDRGNNYFIGEVFALSKELVPNSQRDYFNENPTRVIFERELRHFFNEELSKIYYEGSAINSAFKKIDIAEQKAAEFSSKDEEGIFVNKSHRDGELELVKAARKEATTAEQKIEKLKDKDNILVNKVIKRIEKQHTTIATNSAVKTAEKQVVSTRRVDKLSAYSKNERKLISKIFGIIVKVVDSDTAEMIINKIEEGLQ